MTKVLDDPYSDGDLFLKHFLPGTSERARKLRGDIYRLNVAHKNKRMVPSILLTGERGVGKGYVAHTIAAHLGWLIERKGADISPSTDDSVYVLAERAKLRTQTLTAVPELLAEATLFGAKKGAYTDLKENRTGLFETVDLIDVFLDEIGDSSGGLQAKLLQILESRTFRPLGLSFSVRDQITQARVLAATNRDLEELVNSGVFRSDLYDRLQWARFHLPPLRDQLNELPVIMKRINDALRANYSLEDKLPTEADIEWCEESYSWPGNHRELQQVLWKWHLYDGSVPLKSIVKERVSLSILAEELESSVIPRLFERFEAVLAGRKPGFKTYGECVDEVRNITYKALYLFNKERRLRDEDLKKLFSDQEPTNVRKQISQNRPQSEKE